MKIYLLPFVLVFIVSNNKYFSICYAVVNLLFSSRQQTVLSAWACLCPLPPFGGLKWTFAIWLLRNQVAAPFSHILLAEFGGLKWTRTIDLTLIRRVL